MGWYGQAGRGTHAEIDAELMKSWTDDKGNVYSRTDCKLVNFNTHYSIYRINGEPTCIEVDLIQRYRGNKEGRGFFGGEPEWLYKPLDETMGPTQVDCPLSLLEMVPCPDAQWARDWRDRVRAYHAGRNQVFIAGLKVGDRIQLKDHLKPAYLSNEWLTVSAYKRGRIIAGGYRIKRTLIQAIERTNT